MTAERSTPIHCGTAIAQTAPFAAEFARGLFGVWIGTLAGAAICLAWRRAAGALTTPLSSPFLVLAGVVVAASAVGWRIAQGRLLGKTWVLRLDWLGAALPSATVLLFGAALSLPGSDMAGVIALWAILAGEEAWAWRRAVWGLRRGSKRVVGSRLTRPDGAEAPLPQVVPVRQQTSDLPENVVQQLTRARAVDGSDELTGWLRAAFQGGQRLASIHVAFCPPFERTPQLAVQQLGGPDARVKTTQVLSYGARLDLKLATAAEKPASVLLHFTARTVPHAELPATAE
jgi:hypothetical protein